ncbi:MAG: hypothetical protein QW520_01660 [Methanomassiliicoccales archaeon]
MEILGPCMICSAPARFTCTICGRLVCADHYYPKAGMCSHCIPIEDRKNRHRNEQDGLWPRR